MGSLARRRRGRGPEGRRSVSVWALTALLTVAWVFGSVAAVQLTVQATRGRDRYRDITMFEPARQSLQGHLQVDFLTSRKVRGKAVARYFRAQFAVQPTILTLLERPAEALRHAESSLRRRESYVLLYEYRNEPQLLRLRKELGRAALHGGHVEVARVSPGVAVITVTMDEGGAP